jgi:glycerol kinase
MSDETGIPVKYLRVDGGPTKNSFLMQFQSDIVDTAVLVPAIEELSVFGAARIAGMAIGVYSEDPLSDGENRQQYLPHMDTAERDRRYQGWKEAVNMVL